VQIKQDKLYRTNPTGCSCLYLTEGHFHFKNEFSVQTKAKKSNVRKVKAGGKYRDYRSTCGILVKCYILFTNAAGEQVSMWRQVTGATVGVKEEDPQLCHTYTYTHIHIYAYTYRHTYIYIYIHAYIYIYEFPAQKC